MSEISNIDWTDASWNPTSGCTKVSAGCANCYAEKIHNDFHRRGLKGYEHPFNKVSLHPEKLGLPEKWRKPRKIFVNSMSDLFHQDVPQDFRNKVFKTMKSLPRHIFQVLTKRPGTAYFYSNILDWPENVWMGTTVESESYYTHRLDHLRRLPAAVKFISCEPLIGSLSRLDLSGIDWVIVGGETGKRSRNLSEKWVKEIKQACDKKKVPFFFKPRKLTNLSRNRSISWENNWKKYQEFPACYSAQPGLSDSQQQLIIGE